MDGMPFDDEEFDGIHLRLLLLGASVSTCAQCQCLTYQLHAEKLDRFFDELIRILKPGGLLYWNEVQLPWTGMTVAGHKGTPDAPAFNRWAKLVHQ